MPRLQTLWRRADKALRPSVPGRRGAYALGAILLLIALGYVAFVLSSVDLAEDSEEHFGTPTLAGDRAQPLSLYATILGIDAADEALRLRLYVTPAGSLRGERPNTLGRDLTLRLEDGYDVQELAFHANEPIPPATVEISLDGSTVAAYPLERFHTLLQVSALDGFRAATSDAPERAVPVRLTLWKRIAGWTVRAAEERGNRGEIRLRFGISRTGALTFLVLALYGMMVLIAAAALTIGGLVFLRARKLEATLAGFLSGMLFALPAMRYALPGAPPLGVLADRLVFLWAELAVALGLLLFVLTWAMHGPRQ